ncbi:MAG: DUF1232 domain-containing protein [Dehalococcoidia bacterium]
MPWYGWVLVALFVIFALAAITMRILRSSRRGRKFMSLSTRAKIDFGRALLEDPRLPILDKVALGILVGYLAMPLDLIPDFIPVIGQLDDFLIVSLAVLLLLKTIPPARFDEAVARAERDEARRAEQARAPAAPSR